MEKPMQAGAAGPGPLAACLQRSFVKPLLGGAQLRIHIKSHMEKSKGEKGAVGKVIKASFKGKEGQTEVSFFQPHSFPNFSAGLPILGEPSFPGEALCTYTLALS